MEIILLLRLTRYLGSQLVPRIYYEVTNNLLYNTVLLSSRDDEAQYLGTLVSHETSFSTGGNCFHKLYCSHADLRPCVALA